MLQQQFLQAKAYTAVLQEAAVKLQSKGSRSVPERQQLLHILTALQHLHGCITLLLTRVHQEHITASQDDGEVWPLFDDQLSDWRSSLPKTIHDLITSEQATVEHYQQRRQQSLAAEAAQNSDTAELLGLSPKASTTLAQLVDRLRSIESSVTFQALLHQEAALHAQKTSYSRENFAYNSTPFASWAKVHMQPQIAAAIQAAMCPAVPACGCNSTSSNHHNRRSYMVWGSSTGWLALYAGITYPEWPVIGVELLPGLVKIARQTAEQASLPGVSFICGDLMHTNLADVGVVLLTEQCWDAGLVKQACGKLQQQLPEGAVVLDYTGAMGEAGLRHSQEYTVQVAVGWNDQQKMHAYVKAA